MAMNIYDIEQLKAATLYILNRCGMSDYIHLFKILYFAERKKFAEYGAHLVKDTFCALPKGPVPTFLYDAVKMAAGNKYRKAENLEVIASALLPDEGETEGFFIKAKEPANMEWLSRVDVEILDWAIDTYKDKSSAELSKESHDSAWQESRNGAKPMDSVAIAVAGGATKGFADYLRDQEHLQALLS